MKNHRLRPIVALAFAVLGATSFSQFSHVGTSFYLYSKATSGTDQDIATFNGVDYSPTQYLRTDAYANSLPSTVHAYSTQYWMVSPNAILANLEACWESYDYGAGNSCDVESRMRLVFNLLAPTVVQTNFLGDQSFIDIWNGSSYVNLLDSWVTPNSTMLWNAGTYRFRADRSYQLFGNSTGCVPLDVRIEAVPEPGTMAAMGLGLAAWKRRRR